MGQGISAGIGQDTIGSGRGIGAGVDMGQEVAHIGVWAGTRFILVGYGKFNNLHLQWFRGDGSPLLHCMYPEACRTRAPEGAKRD